MKKDILSTGDKILAAMYDLSKGTTKPLKYEEIVVAAWKKFPQDFGLRGFDYPDSSDIHKPLYGPLKSKGFIRTANKFFSLTEHGISYIQKAIQKPGVTKDAKDQTKRLGRDEQGELDKLLQSDAFRLYNEGEKDKILDSDVYAFYGVTVRTGRNDFLGRISVVSEALENAYRLFPEDIPKKLARELNHFLLNADKFKIIIPQK